MKNRLLRLFQQRPYWGWAGLLFGLAFLQYANTLGHDYAWDDSIVIVENARVQEGIAGIPAHFQMRTRTQLSDFSGFRPVTLSSFAIDQSLAPLNPTVGHLVQVLLFGLLCVVLFYTLLQLFPRYHPIFAFLVSLLFLVHPLHVEVVANIKSRDELLALLFGLLALQTFVRHYRSGKWYWLLPSTLCLLLAVWSKETGYFMIPVLGLAVVTLMEGEWKRKLISLGWLVGQVACLGLVIWLVTGGAPGNINEVSAEVYQENLFMGNSLAMQETDQPGFGHEAQLFYLYLRSFFYPHPLVYYSGYAQITPYAWPSLPLLLCLGLMVVAVLASGFALLKRSRADLAFAAWFFLITIAFFLQPFGNFLADAKADRFMFMPSVGLCLLVISAWYRFMRLGRERSPQEWISARRSLLLGGAGLLFLGLGFLSLKTVIRNMAWKDNLTLFATDMPHLEKCAKAHYYYANALREQVGAEPDRKTKLEIERHYAAAVEITPDAYLSFVEWGRFLNGLGDYAAAETAMLEAVAAHPEQPEVAFLLGQAQYGRGKFTAAVPNLEKALQLDQGPDATWEFLGRALERSGNFAQATSILQQAIARNPANPYLQDALSDTYFDGGQVAESFLPLQKILEMDGNNPIWWKKLIGRYQMIGDEEMASRYYLQARDRGILE